MSSRYLLHLRSGEEPDPRFSLANERTLLSWIRTSLGLVAAGLAVYAFGDDTVPRYLLKPIALGLLFAAATIAVTASTAGLRCRSRCGRSVRSPCPTWPFQSWGC